MAELSVQRAEKNPACRRGLMLLFAIQQLNHLTKCTISLQSVFQISTIATLLFKSRPKSKNIFRLHYIRPSQCLVNVTETQLFPNYNNTIESIPDTT